MNAMVGKDGHKSISMEIQLGSTDYKYIVLYQDMSSRLVVKYHTRLIVRSIARLGTSLVPKQDQNWSLECPIGVPTSKTAQVLKEIERYRLDILGISESRWTGAGRQAGADGSTILFSGKNVDHHTEGVALVVRKDGQITRRMGTIQWKTNQSTLQLQLLQTDIHPVICTNQWRRRWNARCWVRTATGSSF